MTRRESFRAALLLMVCGGQGCATVSLEVARTRPAVLDLAAYRQLAVVPLKDDAGEVVTTQIRTSVAQLRLVDLVDFEVLPADLQVPTALLGGSIDRQDDREEVNSFPFTSVAPEGSVPHVLKTRTARAVLMVTLKMTDARSGQIVATWPLAATAEDSTHATDAEPEPVDRDRLFSQARITLLGEFLQTLRPRARKLRVTLFRDDRAPQLEAGIRDVEAGKDEAALQTFSAITEAGSPPDIVGRAYWNRAMAEILAGRYEAAREDVRTAARLMNKPELLGEIDRIGGLQKEEGPPIR